MGLSLVVGIPATCFLVAFAALKNTLNTLFLIPLLHSSIVGFTVAFFSHPAINNPWVLCKSSQGTFPPWSYLVFYPYLLSTQLYVKLKRRALTEPAYTEICDALFVGGWPCHPQHIPPGNPAVVDCTNELPRVIGLDLPYLCIPSWDTRSPSALSIELAVRWALQKREQNRPILVHCAKGHGRSVAVMCALLVALGVVADWKEGEALVKRHRPRIKMNGAQRKCLEEWQLQHHRRES